MQFCGLLDFAQTSDTAKFYLSDQSKEFDGILFVGSGSVCGK
jgi:hypothetical protein